MLLSEVWGKYQLDKKIEGYSPLTLKTYCFQYNMLLRYFGNIDLNELSTDQLKEYLIKGSTHLKPSSLGHRVRCIRSLFKWANDEGLIKKNPAAKLKEPKLGKRIPKFLTELEIEHLRESCQNSMENALFEFFYSTGCRAVLAKLLILIVMISISRQIRSSFMEKGIKNGRYISILGAPCG